MGRWTFVALTLLLFIPMESFAHANVLSFKVWKQKKIDEATSVVAAARISGKEEGHAQQNLSVAQELTANDYFVLYVTPQFKDNNEALRQSARGLNSKDMADILRGYQHKLMAPDFFGAQSELGVKPAAL